MAHEGGSHAVLSDRGDHVDTAPDEPPGVPSFALRPVLITAGVVALAHLVAASRPGRWFDEALMLAIGRYHLDWGAVDEPPGAPLLARLADDVAPGNHVVLAVPAVLATALAVVLAGLLARELGGDARAQTLTALGQATGVWGAVAGHWLTPYTLEPAIWLSVTWLLVRWQRTRSDRLLLWLGLAIGVGTEIKPQVIAFVLVLALAVLVCGPRQVFARPLFWLGAVLAAAAAAPTEVWQGLHGWPQFAMARSVAAQAFIFGGRWGIAVALIALAGPLAIGLGAVGLVALLRDPRWQPHRFLAVTFLTLLVVFVIPPGRPDYLVGAHGVMAAAGAVTLQWRRERGCSRRRWGACAATSVSISVAGLALVYSIAAQAPTMADLLVARTAHTWSDLPIPQQQRTALWTDTFIYAAYLDTAYPHLGMPPAHSGSVAYGYFPTPAEGQDSLLYVGLSDGEGATALVRLRPFFTDARPVAVVVPPRTQLYGGSTTTTIWLLTGRHAPWTVIQRATRTI